jgi:Zn-dependent M28 family amino/carboxypeptidase
MCRSAWLAIAVAATVAPACSSKPNDPRPLVVRSVEQARITTDLDAIAAPRTPGTAHWQAVQDLCADRFASLGYTVERHAYATGVNVIGVRTGTRVPAEQVIVSAHYDSVANCAGADDNGSGVAGLLEAARVLALQPHARTLVVACWDEEERGLIGSRAYVTRAIAAGDQIAANFVFEMIGYRSTEPGSQRSDEVIGTIFPDVMAQLEANEYRGDFILLIHDTRSDPAVADLTAMAELVSLPTLAIRVLDGLKTNQAAGALRRSDHAPFWDVDYPGIQLTDTAEYRNSHYHCTGGPNVVADLDLAFTTAVVQATAGAAAAALDR